MSQPIIDPTELHKRLLALNDKLTNIRVELQDIASDLDSEVVRFRTLINKVYLVRLETEAHPIEELPLSARLLHEPVELFADDNDDYPSSEFIPHYEVDKMMTSKTKL